MEYTKINNLVDNFFYFIFIFIPLAFVLGPAPLNICLFFSSLGLFFNSYKHENWSWTKSKIFITFLFFNLYILISYWVINFDNISYKEIYKIIGYSRFIFVAFFIVLIFQKIDEKKRKFFIDFNVILICLILLDILIQKIFGKDFFGFQGGMCFGNNFTYFDLDLLKEIKVQNSTYCQRFAGPFDQEFIAGSYIFFIGTIFFALKFLKNTFEFKNHLYFFLFLVLCFVIILITGDRSPFLSFLFALFIFFILDKNTRKYFLRLSLIFMTVGIITIFTNIHVYERYVSVGKALLNINQQTQEINKKDKTQDTILKNKIKLDDEIKFSNKLKQNFYDTTWGAHYLTAVEMFKEKPFFGHGYKSFRSKCKKYDYINSKYVKNRCSTHPHNYILQLFAETGILGVLFFSLFIFSVFKMITNYDKIKNQALFVFLISVLLSFLFPFKPGGSLFSSMNSFIMFYILGWVLYSSNYNDIRIEGK